jgi:hypothetical protein
MVGPPFILCRCRQGYGGGRMYFVDRCVVLEKFTYFLGIILRLFWMFGGIAGLVFLAINIVEGSNRVFFMVFYGVTLTAILGARWADIWFFNGSTISGDAATMIHWIRHAALLLAVSAVFFIALLFLKLIGIFR